MKLEEILKSPMRDPEWVSKCLLMGLLSLIPLVGGFNLLGWKVAIYRNNRAGDSTLPPVSLNYIGDGFMVFVALLPLAGLLFAVMFGTLIVSALVGSMSEAAGAIIGLVGMLAYMAATIGWIVVLPAVFFLHITEGEALASIRFGRLKEIVTGPGYGMFWLTWFVSQLVAVVGEFACFVGLFFTMPLGIAMLGNAISEFEKQRAS